MTSLRRDESVDRRNVLRAAAWASPLVLATVALPVAVASEGSINLLSAGTTPETVTMFTFQMVPPPATPPTTANIYVTDAAGATWVATAVTSPGIGVYTATVHFLFGGPVGASFHVFVAGYTALSFRLPRA